MNVYFLFACSLIIVLPHLLGSMPFIKKYIPVVVLQLLAGILLGPTLLGAAFPHVYKTIFQPTVLKEIDTISQITLVLLGFLIGLHLDTGILKNKSYKKYAFIGVSSVLTPFGIAFPIALTLYHVLPGLAGARASGITFALSIALAASVTALPVLGAILHENGLIKSIEGKYAIVFASANDIVLWILLVLIVGITSAQQFSSTRFLQNIFLLIVFGCVLYGLLRPLLRKLSDRFVATKGVTNKQVAILVGLAFVSAAIAEAIGLQTILGAFMFGTIVPRRVAGKYYRKLESFVFVILVPFFLSSTGLHTVFKITSSETVVIFLAITVASMVGNFIGIAAPSYYYAGFKKHTSILLGIFMQCKGLMEIVVISTFLNAKIISESAFSGMLLMAILTTSLTQPLILLYQKYRGRRPKTTS